MKQVIFLDSVHPILSERLTASGKYHCIEAHSWSDEAAIDALKKAFGIVVRSRFPLNEAILRQAPNLHFIARSGAGMENIDEAYCLANGIKLFNAPEGNRNAVAEHALGMLLSMMNRIHTSHQEVKNGTWNREGNRGVELDGKTVGIIGYGNNGKSFAKKLRGFDVKVLAFDKYKEGYGDDFVMEATLEAVIRKSDVISFHIPQNDETIYFANEEFFDGLGKSIYLLNLSRGKIVETKALIRAIESNKVIAAGLDVNEFEKSSFEAFFQREIPADLQFLLSNDRVLLTPHIGGWTHESYFKLSAVLADKVLNDEELEANATD